MEEYFSEYQKLEKRKNELYSAVQDAPFDTHFSMFRKFEKSTVPN